MRHITDIAALSDADIETLLSGALRYDEALKAGRETGLPLTGRIQFNLFYENSTRTSLSFLVAGRRLGAEVVNVPVAASSVHKGESLRDTVLTLCAQGADFMVLRATGVGSINEATRAIGEQGFKTSVINAGEGAFGHPTQALLDAATLLRAHGRGAGDGLHGITIAIIGDLLHSRVAASCSDLFARLGAEIRLCAPEGLMPAWTVPAGATLLHDLNDALSGVDVAMALRIQKERFEDEVALDPETYRARYGLSSSALMVAKPGVLVMHPGPMNRGVEIEADIADDPERSLILKQVAMGVPLRMAVLSFAADL